MTDAFADLLDRNREYASRFDLLGAPGAAAAGVAMVTCMDSRIDPLAILGLTVGDAKIVRNPGARVTDDALEAMILATDLLGATRVLVVAHTRCAVASNTEEQLRDRVRDACGVDPGEQRFHVVEDQEATLRADVERIRSNPLVPETTAVGGFVYDVDTGLLTQVA